MVPLVHYHQFHTKAEKMNYLKDKIFPSESDLIKESEHILKGSRYYAASQKGLVKLTSNGNTFNIFYKMISTGDLKVTKVVHVVR